MKKFGRKLGSMLKRVAPVMPNQVPGYIQACQRVLAGLELDAMEHEFLAVVSECFENCVFRHNACLRRDAGTEVGSQRAIDRFWRDWDERFDSANSELDRDLVREWQEDLYYLCLFSKAEHFARVQGFATPLAALCHEARIRDLRGRLERLISSQSIRGVSLPALAA